MVINNIKDFNAFEVLSNINSFKSILFDAGLATINGMDNQIALEIAKQIGEIFFHIDSDKEGIVHLAVISEDKRGKNIRGFTANELFCHTDRAVEKFPPDIVILWCNHPAATGGESILVDGKEICQYLLHNHREIFSRLLGKNSAIFSSEGKYHHSEIIESISSDRYAIRFRNDDLGFFSGEILDAVQILKSTIEKLSRKIKLETGDGYVLMNTRWMHGRNLINGPRSFGRIHVNLPTEYGMLKRGFTID